MAVRYLSTKYYQQRDARTNSINMRVQHFSQYGMAACRPVENRNPKTKQALLINKIDMREFPAPELTQNRTSSYSCSSRTSQKKGLKLAKQIRDQPNRDQDKQNTGTSNSCFSSSVTASFGRNLTNQFAYILPMQTSLSNLTSQQIHWVSPQPSRENCQFTCKQGPLDQNRNKLILNKNSIQAIRNSPQPSIRQLSRTQSLGSMTQKRSSISTNVSIESGKGLLNVPTTSSNEYFRGSIIDDLKFPSMKKTT